MLRAYVLNLDAAPERWAFMQEGLRRFPFAITRIAAVDGRTLHATAEEYSDRRYRLLHGRVPNPRHVGCHLSHAAAWRALLMTDESHALVLEDDVIFSECFRQVVAAALAQARSWNLLRLTGLGRGNPRVVTRLVSDFSLCINFGRLKGTGAYLIDRRAAAGFLAHALPVRLPIDHAMDREWFYGLRALSVCPFPCSQTDSAFRTSIQNVHSPKLSLLRRLLTTYPYQAYNEIARLLFRTVQYLRFKL